MVIKRWNGRSDKIFFFNSSKRDFHSRECSFHSVLISQDWNNQLNMWYISTHANFT